MMRFDAAAMHRLRERALRALVRSGWAGAAGVALLAFALAFGLSTGAEQAEQGAALAAERAELLRVAAAPVAVPVSDRSRLADFYARFAPAAELSAVMAGVHMAAERHGLLPERGDYRSAAVSGTPLLRVTATLPVSGRFEALHAWLGEVLGAQSGVAIEQLSIKREAARSDLVVADVRLSILVRQAQ